MPGAWKVWAEDVTLAAEQVLARVKSDNDKVYFQVIECLFILIM